MFERRKTEHPWDGRIEPLKIIGNVYFAGTYQASVHLIDTGDGLILIDTGYENTLYLVIRSIYELGFAPKDIRYIIHTHWHGDHTEATRALVDLSGSKTLIGRYDEEKARQYFTPDILIRDGDTLALGNTAIHLMETPGHTRGTVSLFFETEENGIVYRVGMFGGAGSNTLASGHFEYDTCREDYRHSLARLKKERVDVFIGNHTWNNDTEKKAKILRDTGENQFVDGKLWRRFLEYREYRLEALIQKEQQM